MRWKAAACAIPTRVTAAHALNDRCLRMRSASITACVNICRMRNSQRHQRRATKPTRADLTNPSRKTIFSPRRTLPSHTLTTRTAHSRHKAFPLVPHHSHSHKEMTPRTLVLCACGRWLLVVVSRLHVTSTLCKRTQRERSA